MTQNNHSDSSPADDQVDKESDSGISDASGQQVAAPSYVQLLTQVPDQSECSV